MELMISKEVDMLYQLIPGLDDPYYEGKEVLHTIGETSYIKITIYDDVFICKSNPHVDDVWFYLGK